MPDQLIGIDATISDIVDRLKNPTEYVRRVLENKVGLQT